MSLFAFLSVILDNSTHLRTEVDIASERHLKNKGTPGEQHMNTFFKKFFVVLALGALSPSFAHAYHECDRYEYQIHRVEFQIARLRDQQSALFDRIDDIEYQRQIALQKVEDYYQRSIARYELCDYGSSQSSHIPSYCRYADIKLAQLEAQKDRKVENIELSYDRREQAAQLQAERRYESYERRIDLLNYRIYELTRQQDDCEAWWNWW